MKKAIGMHITFAIWDATAFLYKHGIISLATAKRIESRWFPAC